MILLIVAILFSVLYQIAMLKLKAIDYITGISTVNKMNETDIISMESIFNDIDSQISHFYSKKYTEFTLKCLVTSKCA